MNTKKNIDELFKEQLQNLEAAPSPMVWKNIQAKIKGEDEDRKVIPIWWKLGGVAAILALLLTVGNIWTKPDSLDGNPIGTEEKKIEPSDKNTDPNIEKNNHKNPIASEKEEEELYNSEQDKNSTSEAIKNKIIETPIRDKNKVAKTPISPNNTEKNYSIKKNKTIVGSAIADDNSKKEKTPITRDALSKKDATIDRFNKDKEAVAGISSSSQTDKNSSSDIKNKATNKLDDLIKKDVLDINKNKEGDVGIAVEKTEKLQEEENKKSIFDAIEENKKEAEAIATADAPKSGSWEITPNVGPVFYNSLSEGSSIDPSFSDNSQSGETNISYGVSVSYAISDRFSVRSGVNNVNLGYSTGDIEVANGPVALGLSTIDYGDRTQVTAVFDRGTLAGQPLGAEDNPFANVIPRSTGSGSPQLIQNIQYYEVPLEINYAFLDSRFGINMIGGFSTLFLGDNEIAIENTGFREVLGEANNLNSVSFSTNIGVGFNYKLSKKLKFNVEPTFKYQINPYSDSSVDFQPYYLGIYSGLSFKF